MPVKLNWVNETAYERIGLTRGRCYGAGTDQLERFDKSVTSDPRVKPGDYLLATDGSEDVGTLTTMSLEMFMRGAKLRCQGVAFVGTIKTRRRRGSGGEAGVASLLMRESLKRARERGEVISALMPFRASYYEHFGYGFAERRVEWRVPLSILPKGDFAGCRFLEDGDVPALVELSKRSAGVGQCDIPTEAATWRMWIESLASGFCYVDECDAHDANAPRCSEAADPASSKDDQPLRRSVARPLRAFCAITDEMDGDRRIARVADQVVDSHESLLRLLSFLGSLKDQYSAAIVTLPADVPLNRMLIETQIPHRQVDHPFAKSRPFTRMQIRVMDHKAVVEALALPATMRGRTVVSVRECEGAESRFVLDLSDGHASVKPTGEAARVEMSDVLWASIVSGDLDANVARRAALIRADDETVNVLSAFGVGPVPYCSEYF